MGGDLRRDYEDSKQIVENMFSELKLERAKLKSLTSPDQINAQKKKIADLEKYINEFEGERDKLKHQVEDIDKQEKAAQLAALVPGEGTIASVVLSAKTKSESSRASKNAEKKMGNLQEKIRKVKMQEIEDAQIINDSSSHNVPPQQNPPQNPSEYATQENYSSPKQNRFKKFFNFFKSSGNHEEVETPRIAIEILLLLAIIVHLADAKWLSFSLSAAAIGYRITMYFVFCIFVHIIINRGWAIQDSILEMLKVSAIPLFIVPLISIIMNWLSAPEAVVKSVSKIILLFPIWLVYIAFIRGKIAPLEKGARGFFKLFLPVSGWVRLYLFYLGILVLFFLLSTTGAVLSGSSDSPIPGIGGIPGAENSGFDFSTSSKGVIELFTKGTAKMAISFKDFVNGTKTGFKNLQNETMGSYYTGQVEQNKEQTGIFITDFHVTGKQYDSMPLVAYGYIKARSFVENITITPTCYAQSATNKSIRFEGTVDPDTLDNIYIEDQRGVLCTFERDKNSGLNEFGGLPAGRYQVNLVLNFNFETWAYKQYYFIDRSYLVYLKTSGENVNTKLVIPQKTKTIYTSGPVMVGMDDSIEMPFPLSADGTNYLPIGITIDNKDQMYGARGEVMKVFNYTLRMPEAFVINMDGRPCSIPTEDIKKEVDANVPGYNLYTFSTPADLNLSGAYMTLNCNLVIDENLMSSVIPSANSPALISVIGTTQYSYKLSKMVSVTVEKTPGT